MFDIGFPELILVSIVALLVIGPDKLPETVRTIVLWVGRFKRSLANIRMEIENEIGADEIRQQLHNESILKELDEAKAQLKGVLNDTEASLNSIKDSANIMSSVKPKTTSSETISGSTSSDLASSESTSSESTSSEPTTPTASNDSDRSTQNPVDEGQPLIEHLIELRSRTLRSLIAVVIIFLPLFYFANDLYGFISEPLRTYLPEGATMIATEVASPFLTPFKLTLVLAIFIAIPYILHQIWSFIAPGLYANEKRIAVPLLVSSVLLFYGGIAFAFYVVFPLIFGFFTSAAPEGVTVMTDINRYLDFVLKLFFAFGLAFEIPIATLLMVWTGATSVQNLRDKRPYVIVACFVVGMLLTPPDVISQLLLAIPMWILYEAGIVFSTMIRPQEESAAE